MIILINETTKKKNVNLVDDEFYNRQKTNVFLLKIKSAARK